MSAPETPKPSPADELVAILVRELPGFTSSIHAQTDTIRVQGPLKFGASLALDVLYPVYEGAEEAIARRLIEQTRRAGIEALGIEATIVERERAAFERGQRTGYDIGRAEGYANGRRDMLAEVLEARPEDETDA